MKNLDRPGTNVTGTTMYAPQLIGERLRILQRIVPNLDKVAMVLNGNNPNNAAQFELLRSEAGKLGIEVLALDIRKPEDVKAIKPHHGVTCSVGTMQRQAITPLR